MITPALEERMGHHKQPPTGTPLETDNATAHGILHATVRMKKSKAFDMRYHWLKDRVSQKQFNLYDWSSGKLNSADCYFSKHHPAPLNINSCATSIFIVHSLLFMLRLVLLKILSVLHSHFMHVTPPVRGCVSRPLSRHLRVRHFHR
jgi:hypothetical protein